MPEGFEAEIWRPAAGLAQSGAVHVRTGPVDVIMQRVAQIGPAAGDAQASRVVYAMVAALAIVGVLLVCLAIWLIRQTRVDAELLGPLERMDEAQWRKSDADRRRELLDEVRPAGARTPSSPDQPEPVEVTELAELPELPELVPPGLAESPPASADAVEPTALEGEAAVEGEPAVEG